MYRDREGRGGAKFFRGGGAAGAKFIGRAEGGGDIYLMRKLSMVTRVYSRCRYCTTASVMLREICQSFQTCLMNFETIQ